MLNLIYMNLSDTILKILFEPRLRYKGVPVSLVGLPVNGYKKQSLYNSFSKLKKGGYILTKNDRMFLSHVGRKYIERKIDSMKQFQSCFLKDAPKNLIIMYDIPQDKRAEREWLRFQLIKFGYEMIQKSVWVGPSPLPREFVAYTKRIHLGDCIKILKLAKSYQADSFSL